MRFWIIIFIIIVCMVLLFVGYAQEPKPSPNQGTQNQQTPNQQAPKPAPQPPKTGTLRVQGKPLSFFNNAEESTLRLSGHGVVLVSDLNGTLEVKGFQELKKLPAGVQLKPEYAKRVRIFSGRGSIVVKGTYKSVRTNFHEAKIEFNGRGSFIISGEGEYQLDGRKVPLYNVPSTIYVPPPQWMRQLTPSPPANEPVSKK